MLHLHHVLFVEEIKCQRKIVAPILAVGIAAVLELVEAIGGIEAEARGKTVKRKHVGAQLQIDAVVQLGAETIGFHKRAAVIIRRREIDLI